MRLTDMVPNKSGPILLRVREGTPPTQRATLSPMGPSVYLAHTRTRTHARASQYQAAGRSLSPGWPYLFGPGTPWDAAQGTLGYTLWVRLG